MAAVCVFCSSSGRIDPAYVELATAVGTELARRGHSLVSGGGSVSCMGAVARAARAGFHTHPPSQGDDPIPQASWRHVRAHERLVIQAAGERKPVPVV